MIIAMIVILSLCLVVFTVFGIIIYTDERRNKTIKSFRKRYERIALSLSILEISVARFRHKIKMYDELERKRQNIENIAKFIAKEIENIENGDKEE